jgi:hypothetical protein
MRTRSRPVGELSDSTYLLNTTPEGDIYVFLNNDPMGIPMDPSNGWSYDPTIGTLTFHG